MEPKHPQKGIFVSQLRAGERVTAFFLARRKQLEPFRDRTKGEFLTVLLGDRTGEVLARVWENAPEVAASFAEGDVVKVAGDVEEYLGRTQLIVNRLRQAEPQEYDLADFLPSSGKDAAELWPAVDGALERISEPNLSALVRHYYDDPDFRAQLEAAPATRRVHHAYLGGLLEHLAEILALCDAVLDLYPDVNADLLRAGALLHDVGKLREYTWTQGIEYTDEGRLIGHIVLSDELVAQTMAALPGFPEELKLRVRHMLVSQHGRYEWGSPRRPMTLEAIALHHVQNLSAQLNRFRSVLAARREPGQAWTPYNRLLDRQLFAGQGDDWDEEPE